MTDRLRVLALFAAIVPFVLARPSSAGAEAPHGAIEGVPTVERLATKPGFIVDEVDPETHVPSQAQANESPVQFGYFLMDLADRADAALKTGDYEAAARYFRAVTKAVPERSVGYAKLCEVYQRLHDRPRALESCRAALDHEGVTIADFASYVRLVMARQGKLSDDEVEAAREAIAHLQRQPDVGLAGWHLQCELSVRVRDGRGLSECTQALSVAAPEDPKTLSFAWALAIEEHRLEDAKALIARAARAGLGAVAVKEMERTTSAAARSSSASVGQRSERTTLWPVLAFVAVSAAAAAALHLRRARAA